MNTSQNLFPVIGSAEAARYIGCGRTAGNSVRDQIAAARRAGAIEGAVMLATVRGMVQEAEAKSTRDSSDGPEHQTHNLEVAGSNPAPATTFIAAGSGAGAGRAAAIAEAGGDKTITTTAEMQPCRP